LVFPCPPLVKVVFRCGFSFVFTLCFVPLLPSLSLCWAPPIPLPWNRASLSATTNFLSPPQQIRQGLLVFIPFTVVWKDACTVFLFFPSSINLSFLPSPKNFFPPSLPFLSGVFFERSSPLLFHATGVQGGTCSLGCLSFSGPLLSLFPTGTRAFFPIVTIRVK